MRAMVRGEDPHKNSAQILPRPNASPLTKDLRWQHPYHEGAILRQRSTRGGCPRTSADAKFVWRGQRAPEARPQCARQSHLTEVLFVQVSGLQLDTSGNCR